MSIFKKTKGNKNHTTTNNIAIINENSSFQAKEAYKTLRTNIMFSLPKNDLSKVILFTSAGPGEGKTTTLINLAISFVELGKKIILLDCDLRKPKIHKYAKIPQKVGISNVLGGFAKAEDCIVKTDYGFDCIVAGQIPPNPSELLDSTAMDDILNELKQKYEYILIDTPPINIVAETASMAAKADGTILLASQNNSTKPEFDRAISILKFSNAKILGFVLNNAKTSGNRYDKIIYNNPVFRKIIRKTKQGYSYYYSYSYGYGYSYGKNYELSKSQDNDEKANENN